MQGVLHGRHHRVIRVRRAVAEVHAHTELVVLNRRAWDFLHPADSTQEIECGRLLCMCYASLLPCSFISIVCKGCLRY